jgi:CubicO group peptidase (beta-lactamase class C family)
MKRHILILLAVIQLVSCTGQNSSTSINKEDVSKKTDQLINQYIDLGIFSGVVLVAEKGIPLYHKAFGLADRENNIPNTLNTLFDIGSMNKTFTSIVVKQLIAEGKLRYSDKLVAFVDGFEDKRVASVTVEHLLNHESGFGDYHRDGYFVLPKSEKTLDKIIERMKGGQLLFAPGEENEYSNSGYVLLGAIIEKVSRKSYFANVKQRIIQPLGLKNTYVENLDRFKDRVAYGYLYSPLGALEKNETLQDLPNPDGGFLSTTLDVLKFYRSYYNDDVLLNEKIKSQDPFFQWIRELPKGKAPSVAGGFEGFNTALFQVISDDRSIIVFANMDEPVAESIALGILQITRGKEPDQPKLPAIQNVRRAFEKNGVDFVKQNFEDLTTNFHPADPKDLILNQLGYAYMFGKDDIDSAIELFKINTELFPNNGNCWDSYGESLLKKGDKEAALSAYKKALEINPNIPSSKKAVKELEN